MARTRYIALPLLMTWLASGGTTFAAPAPALPMRPDPRREIQEALRRSDDSLHRKDIWGYMVGFTPDFHGESINGDRYDRNQAKQNLIKSLAYAQSATAHTSVKNVTIVKGQAVVVTQEHTALTILGRRTHRVHTLVFDGLWRSVWVETRFGWQIASDKQLTSAVITDGVRKVVQPARAR